MAVKVEHQGTCRHCYRKVGGWSMWLYEWSALCAAPCPHCHKEGW